MWVKLNNKEIDRYKSQDRFKKICGSVFIGIFLSIVFTVIHGGVFSMDTPAVIRSLDEIENRLGISIFFGVLIVSPLLYFFVLNRKAVYVVCPKCNKIKADDGILSCDCGTCFEDIKSMKWVELKKHS